MDKIEFKKRAKHHDWYYAWSDDSRVYRSGREREKELQQAHKELACPFDLGIH